MNLARTTGVDRQVHLKGEEMGTVSAYAFVPGHTAAVNAES